MENQHADLLTMLRFQEDLIRLTQGLKTGASPEHDTVSPVSELLQIARKASLRA